MPTPHLPIDKNLFNSLSIGVVLCDSEDNIVWVNDGFLELMVAERNSVIGAPAAALLKHNLTTTVNAPDVMRYETTSDDGRTLWLHCISAPIKVDGKLTYSLRLLLDITEFQQRRNLRSLITTGIEDSRLDQISGILNRRAIIQELNAEISRTRRYGNPLGLILLRYPVPVIMHEDNVSTLLQSLANTLNEQLRWVDKLGALDKGEFLVVLPESDEDSARQTWKKINHAIQEVTMRPEQMNLDYTVAITDWVKNDTPDTMLERLQSTIAEQKVA